jgi:DNA-binding beta-propeller fold protein YncE
MLRPTAVTYAAGKVYVADRSPTKMHTISEQRYFLCFYFSDLNHLDYSGSIEVLHTHAYEWRVAYDIEILGIAVDAKENIYITARTSNRILKISPSGIILTS